MRQVARQVQVRALPEDGLLQQVSARCRSGRSSSRLVDSTSNGCKACNDPGEGCSVDRSAILDWLYVDWSSLSWPSVLSHKVLALRSDASMVTSLPLATLADDIPNKVFRADLILTGALQSRRPCAHKSLLPCFIRSSRARRDCQLADWPTHKLKCQRKAS